MKLFDRDFSIYIRRIPQLPLYLYYFAKCFWKIRNPLGFIFAYLRRKGIPTRIIELRDGLKIYLSEHPHDIISVFVVFVREDYGHITPGCTVVDIGANIGIFSLYAAHEQAAKIYAYEANTASLHCLLQNIEANHLENVIIPMQYAVIGSPGDKVRFPVAPSAYNAIITRDVSTEFEWVDTIGLPAILEVTGSINLLKLDCEGAEYGILFSAGADVYSRIQNIRLEYHSRREQEIQNHLAKFGYIQRLHKADTACSGNMWYEKVA